METIDSPVAHFTEVVKSPKAAPDCKRYLNKQTKLDATASQNLNEMQDLLHVISF